MITDISEAVEQLNFMFDELGDEVFFSALIEMLNTHPQIKSGNVFLLWDVLLLYRNYDPDRVLEVSQDTMIENGRIELIERLG